MHVVLWDTRKLDVSKDFAGGFGVGRYPGYGGLRGKIIRWFFTRDHRPVALIYAYLAAIFRRLGHTVEYVVDRTDVPADLYVFCPSLITLDLERSAIGRVLAEVAGVRVLVVGAVATALPEAFAALNVTVVKGEAEQLLWKLDEVLARPGTSVHLGILENLDLLPLPDWSLFRPERFRIGYDFWKFPTALIQQSRGCSFRCNYCPYLLLDRTVRYRDPEAVVDEICYGMRRWGFQSFKFRDPLFGLDRARVYRLAELLQHLPRPIQFSVETRIDLMPPEILRVLQRVGLTSITVGIETPDHGTLRRYRRAAISDDRQREFISLCRGLHIRTVAGFMVGFPEDTPQSIHNVLDYAKSLGPTFANFNVVTPYPGTDFYEQAKDRLTEVPFTHYTVYHPVLRCQHLSADELRRLVGNCFTHYYFRWGYMRENASLIWPALRRLGLGRRAPRRLGGDPAHRGVPRPLSGADLLLRQGLRRDGPHPSFRASSQPSDPDEAA